jgi:hypothetical protein
LEVDKFDARCIVNHSAPVQTVTPCFELSLRFFNPPAPSVAGQYHNPVLTLTWSLLDLKKVKRQLRAIRAAREAYAKAMLEE